MKLNINDFEELNNASKEFDKEITDYNSNLSNYFDKYKGGVSDFLKEYFRIKESNIFSLDFSLPNIPKNPTESNIDLSKMNKDSENLCVPIINIDSEGKNLICCYKTLELNLGKTCPAFYQKPYIINIISFVNEDMTVKVKSYKESKIEENKKKEENDEIKDENKKEEENEIKDDEEKEKEDNMDEEIKDLDNINFGGEEIINRLLSVKDIVKKGENIELYVEIPKTFEEETIKINSILEIESNSVTKLELETNIILTTIPIFVLISCQKYKLIKQKINYDNNITFEQCFKLDTKEFLGDEEINFDIINYKSNEPIEFYLSTKSLENNTSSKPIFLTNKKI